MKYFLIIIIKILLLLFGVYNFLIVRLYENIPQNEAIIENIKEPIKPNAFIVDEAQFILLSK